MMKTAEAFAAGETVAQLFDRNHDAEKAANRLRAAGFSDVRLSEAAGRTSDEHIRAEAGATEIDFTALLEAAGFSPDRARELTRAVAAGAVLLTVAAGSHVADAVAVLRGEAVAARPLGPVEVRRAADADVVRAEAPPVPPSPPLAPGDRVLPLRAEQLEISKQRTTRDARVSKEVVTEQKTFTVPVSREQLVVERDGEPAIRIPLHESEPPGSA
jgi:Domain of unknown function (DUF2382)